MEHVWIGCTGFGPEGRSLLRRVTLVEVQESFLAPPKAATMDRWREMAPSGVAFSLRAWQAITHGRESPAWARQPPRFRDDPRPAGLFQQSAAVTQAYEVMLECAEALGAGALLFDTPAAFTPTRAHRDQMRAFFEQVRRPPHLVLAWEPRGLWEAAEIGALCAECGLVAAVDPLAPGSFWPQGEVAYLKLASPRYTEGDLQLLAEGFERYEQVYCVFAGLEAVTSAERLLREME